MLLEAIVDNIFHGEDKNFITYVDIEDGIEKCAGLPDNIDPCVGDTVEIFTDDYVSYRGSRAIVLRVIKKG